MCLCFLGLAPHCHSCVWCWFNSVKQPGSPKYTRINKRKKKNSKQTHDLIRGTKRQNSLSRSCYCCKCPFHAMEEALLNQSKASYPDKDRYACWWTAREAIPLLLQPALNACPTILHRVSTVICFFLPLDKRISVLLNTLSFRWNLKLFLKFENLLYAFTGIMWIWYNDVQQC